MNSFSLKATLISLALIIPVLSYSQLDLEPAVVTAAKFEQKQSQVTRFVEVITDSTIQSNLNLSLGQLLSQQAGIQIVGSSQPLGSVQNVFTRGAGAAFTQILLDGVPLYDGSAIGGNFDINFIDLTHIERIEILKAGQSTLYGSNAVAGTINIITKREEKGVFNPRVGVQYGSFNTLEVNPSLLGKVGNLQYNFNYNRTQSDGFSSAIDRNDTGTFDNDGFARNSLYSRIQTSIGKVHFGVYGNWSKYKTEIDNGAFSDDADHTGEFTNYQIGGFFDYKSEKSKLNFNYSTSFIDRQFVNDSLSVAPDAFNIYSKSTFGAASNFLDLNYTLKVGEKWNWLLGVEYLQQNMEQTFESVSGFGLFVDVPIESDQATIGNTSVYTSIQFQNGRFGIDGGSRLNNHSIYGWNASFTSSGFARLAESLKLIAVADNSFRNPGLYQLYSIYGNQELRPEQSVNFELGLEYFKSFDDKLSLVFFNRTIKDVIQFLGTDAPPFGIYQNRDVQRSYGIELGFDKTIAKLNVRGNYTYTHGFQYMDGQVDIDRSFGLLRIPEHAVNLGTTYSLTPNLEINLQCDFQSDRVDLFFNSTTFSSEEVVLNAFTLMHANLTYRMNSRLSARLTVRNMFDSNFSEIYGFNSEPRSLKVGLFFR